MWEVRVSGVDGDHHLGDFDSYEEAYEFSCDWLGVEMKWGHGTEVTKYGDLLYMESDEELPSIKEL